MADRAGSHTGRIYNFSAGPAVLPDDVLHRAQESIWDHDHTGIGILEHSHRGRAFDAVIEEAEADCRDVGEIPDDYDVLFLQGGASLQFAMIPMNFLSHDRSADYINTGVWAHKALEMARGFGNVSIAFDGSGCSYDHTPGADELALDPGAAYLHYCSNNTIHGTRFPSPPESTANVPLIVDASSEIFSRPIAVPRHACIYAGAQKNLGPAGVTLVIIRRDFSESAPSDLSPMLSYAVHAEKGSRYNTPPVFSIFVMGQVFKWIMAQGGLARLEQANREKAAIIYDAIDTGSGFYSGKAAPQCRSTMNITFRTPDVSLDKALVDEALAQDMSGLKGHRSAGGLRASVYNAFPIAGCRVLAEFMADFAMRHG